MASTELPAWTRGFAAAGAALKAARDGDVEHGQTEYAVRDGQLVLTGMLADKTLRQIEAGEDLPDEIDLDFDGSAKLIRYVIMILTHMGPEHSLVADHPAFDPPPGP